MSILSHNVCMFKYYFVLIGLTQQYGKLVFVASRPKLSVIARPVRTLVVAIPRLEGKCIDNCPTERGNTAIFGGNRYLFPFNRGIATPVCALVRNHHV